MLQLTKRTEYGLIALLHLANSEGRVVPVREIGERFPLPKRVLAESLKDLGRAGIVESQRGAAGGYWLARGAGQITLGEVISALEGAPTLTSCQDLGASNARGQCEVQPVCPIRSPLTRLRQGIWALLEGTTLRSLANPSLTPADLLAAAGSPLSSPLGDQPAA
ncbi:MAG: Rrf2 family transcriptional regulator [Planctomycetota bacterium]|nr:Rrf2 family transcriptional regulator [Planctomycetota bacterium]